MITQMRGTDGLNMQQEKTKGKSRFMRQINRKLKISLVIGKFRGAVKMTLKF